MEKLSCLVEENKAEAEGYYLLRISLPQIHEQPRPGQFMTLRIGNSASPLLRRPFAFSAYDSKTKSAEILYERRGQATNLLSSYQKGDDVDVISPLGNSFPLPEKGVRAVLFAGGIGLGPMLYFHRHLKTLGLPSRLLVGARTRSKLPLGLLPSEAELCTDDGSEGFRGTVLDLFREKSDCADLSEYSFYLCGPHGMMKAVHRYLEEKNYGGHVWVSLEQTMGCAVGACMGCVVKTHHEKKYLRVCTEGPIFESSLIDWN